MGSDEIDEIPVVPLVPVKHAKARTERFYQNGYVQAGLGIAVVALIYLARKRCTKRNDGDYERV